jgi:glycosyltransferase involved in cell wall biosynthesis
MSLVIDLRMINVSGIGTYLKNIAPEVIKKYQKVVLLGDPEELKQFSWSHGITIIEFKEKIYSIKEQIVFPKVIPNCDVFWCPHFNVSLLPIKAKTIITTIYDVNHLSVINKSSFLKKLYSHLLYKNATYKAAQIITISEFSKSEIIKYTKADERKIKMIYCGVDKTKFSQQNEDLTNLSLPEKYILFVGNVKPHKNLITLLKAYAQLPSKYKSEYKIVIVGKREGFLTKDNLIFNFIEEQNLKKDIFFTGYILDNQVPSVYANASLFVFPSLYEGFGLPILEAMCCNIPVISSDAASLKEVGGNAVEYFSPLDDKELVLKIEKLLTNPKLLEDYITKGKEQVEKFNWSKAKEDHLEIFNKYLL